MVASLFYLCHTRRCACSSAGCSGPGLSDGNGSSAALSDFNTSGVDIPWSSEWPKIEPGHGHSDPAMRLYRSSHLGSDLNLGSFHDGGSNDTEDSDSANDGGSNDTEEYQIQDDGARPAGLWRGDPFAVVAMVLVIVVASAMNSNTSVLLMLGLLMHIKATQAMDPSEISHNDGLAQDPNAASGLVIGLALAAGAAFLYGRLPGADDDRRQRRIRQRISSISADAGTEANTAPTAPDLDRQEYSTAKDSETSVAAPVLIPPVQLDRDHALEQHTSPFNRCAPCHRKSKCDPSHCAYHDGLAEKVRRRFNLHADVLSIT